MRKPLLSVAMLAGFPLVAVLQLALVVAPVLLVLQILPGDVAMRAGMPLCTATVGVLAYATGRALHLRHPEPVGIPVTRDDAPELWTMLDAAAALAGARPAGRVVVVAEAAVLLTERTRLLGLIGGPRALYLGLPLLQAWDHAEVRAAVAHEFGRSSTRLGRWAPVAYRGRVVIGRTVPRIPRRNPAGPLLRAWAALYRRVDAPVGRTQELTADRIAAEFAGGAAAVAALRDQPVIEAMLRVFHSEYLRPGWQAGRAPDDIFGGFLRVLAARAGEVAALRGAEPAAPADPPLAERVAAIDPATPAQTPPTQGQLVPDLPGLGRALQAVAFPPQGRKVTGWDEFFGAARTAEVEREADAALAVISRAAGTPVTTVADVLGLIAAGKLDKPDRFADLLALAALRSGAARWRHSWTGAAALVTADGRHLDMDGLATRAAPEELAELGIDLKVAGPAGGPAEVVGGLVNLVVDGARTDLLIADTGLLLVPGLPRSRNGSAKRRLAQLAATDRKMRDDAMPGSRFVPYTEVAAATRTRRTPKSWDLSLRDGGTMTVRTALDSDELPGGWAALDEAVEFLTRSSR